MTDFMIGLLMILAFGTGAFIYGHFFLYPKAMRLKRKQEAERNGNSASGRRA